MSFLDDLFSGDFGAAWDDVTATASDIWDVGAGAASWLGGSGVGPALARTAITGAAVGVISSMIQKDNAPASNPAAQTQTPDPGVRLQVPVDPEHRIPVVYGEAYLGGIVTDAMMSNDNSAMTFCLVYCEKTGHTITGQSSVISIGDVYMNGNLVTFDTDGQTIVSTTDSANVTDSTMNGFLKISFYSGSSSLAVLPNGTGGGTQPAYSRMLGWTTNHTMNDLVFAIVQVIYNKEANVTGLPDFKVQIKNSMTQPGDCLYDYMTNARYGCGINGQDIYAL